jgi:hypothetical protein
MGPKRCSIQYGSWPRLRASGCRIAPTIPEVAERQLEHLWLCHPSCGCHSWCCVDTSYQLDLLSLFETDCKYSSYRYNIPIQRISILPCRMSKRLYQRWDKRQSEKLLGGKVREGNPARRQIEDCNQVARSRSGESRHCNLHSTWNIYLVELSF